MNKMQIGLTLNLVASIAMILSIFLPLVVVPPLQVSLYEISMLAKHVQEFGHEVFEYEDEDFIQYLWLIVIGPAVLALFSMAIPKRNLSAVLNVIFGLVGLTFAAFLIVMILDETGTTVQNVSSLLQTGYYMYVVGALVLVVGSILRIGKVKVEPGGIRISGRALDYAGAGIAVVALAVGSVHVINKVIPKPSRIDLQVTQGTTQLGIKALNITVTNRSQKPVFLHKPYSLSMHEKTDYRLTAYSYTNENQTWQELPHTLWNFPSERVMEFSEAKKIAPNAKVMASLQLLYKCDRVKVVAINVDGADTVEEIAEIAPLQKKSLFR